MGTTVHLHAKRSVRHLIVGYNRAQCSAPLYFNLIVLRIEPLTALWDLKSEILKRPQLQSVPYFQPKRDKRNVLCWHFSFSKKQI